MGSNNPEGRCQKNNSMAKEYSSLVAKHGNGRAQLFMLEYHSEKENSLYPVMFVMAGYSASACQWSKIIITQRMVFMLYKRLPL